MAQAVKKLLQIQETQGTQVLGGFPRRRKWQPTAVFLPEKPHRQRSLVDFSLGGLKESDMIEHARRRRGASYQVREAIRFIFKKSKTNLRSKMWCSLWASNRKVSLKDGKLIELDYRWNQAPGYSLRRLLKVETVAPGMLQAHRL